MCAWRVDSAAHSRVLCPQLTAHTCCRRVLACAYGPFSGQQLRSGCTSVCSSWPPRTCSTRRLSCWAAGALGDRAGLQAHLVTVLASIATPPALVLRRVHGVPLALKPNHESLLRCRWASGARFVPAFVLRVAQGVADALAYLHRQCICHGELLLSALLPSWGMLSRAMPDGCKASSQHLSALITCFSYMSQAMAPGCWHQVCSQAVDACKMHQS